MDGARPFFAGVGAGAAPPRGGDRPGRKRPPAGPAERELPRLDPAVRVGYGLDRRESLGEGDSFLEGLDHFLVVQPVRGRIVQRLAVGDGDTAPRLHQPRKVGLVVRRGGALALVPYLAAVLQR